MSWLSIRATTQSNSPGPFGHEPPNSNSIPGTITRSRLFRARLPSLDSITQADSSPLGRQEQCLRISAPTCHQRTRCPRRLWIPMQLVRHWQGRRGGRMLAAAGLSGGTEYGLRLASLATILALHAFSHLGHQRSLW